MISYIIGILISKLIFSFLMENSNNLNASAIAVVVQGGGPDVVNEVDNQSRQSSTTRTPFTNLSQLDADLALARTLQEQGQNNLQSFCAPKLEDVATISYTSGTTGTPKGAVLSHGNLIASIAGATISTKLYPYDVYISYFPLVHKYERANQVMLVYFGTAAGFYQGDNLKLMDDMGTLRPTVFCSVPRLYNRIYAGFVLFAALKYLHLEIANRELPSELENFECAEWSKYSVLSG